MTGLNSVPTGLTPDLDVLGPSAAAAVLVALSMTAPTARDRASSVVPAIAIAMNPTHAAPPRGVVAHDSPKISGARRTGTTPGRRTSPGRWCLAGRRWRALISLSSAKPSEAAAAASQATATSSAPGGELAR